MLFAVPVVIAALCALHINCNQLEEKIHNDTNYIDTNIPGRKSANYNKYYKKKSFEQNYNKKYTDSILSKNISVDFRKGLKIGVVQPKMLLDKFVGNVLDYLKNNIQLNLQTDYRYNLQPDVVDIKRHKPIITFEMNPQNVMNAINNFLKTETFNKNFDNLVKKARYIYRALQEEAATKHRL